MYKYSTRGILLSLIMCQVMLGCSENATGSGSGNNGGTGTTGASPPIIITEIKGDSDVVDDYIELYNWGASAINIHDYFITDSKNAPSTIAAQDRLLLRGTLPAKSYLLVCTKVQGQYDSLSVPCAATVGQLGIGTQEREGIHLYTNKEASVDSVIVPIMDNDSLNLGDASLALDVSPDLVADHTANDAASSWRPSTVTLGPGSDKGTPGIANGSTANAPPSQTIIITEIKGHKENIDDYIEIYNTTNATIDISSYYVTDAQVADSTKRVTINQGVTLAARSYGVICTKQNGDYHGITCLSTSGEIGIGRQEDGIWLRNSSGVTIDGVVSPVENDDSLKPADGTSLELANNRLTKAHNDLAANWAAATAALGSQDKGTPGGTNSFSK